MTTLKTRETAADLSPTASPIASVAKPSRWRRICTQVKRHPKLVTTACLLSLLGATGVFLLYLLFKGAWSQDKNNVAILHTILKMELAREDTLAIEDDPQQVVTRTYLTLEPHVGTDGWQWINRFGGTTTYGKQNQRLIASCAPYSPVYLVCNLSEIP